MDLNLRQLEARFIKNIDGRVRHYVNTLEEADGVWYACPKCYLENKGLVGTHYVLNWFKGKVPDDLDPKPGRWYPQGTLDTLTFTPPLPNSVQINGGCNGHWHIVNGRAVSIT